MMPCGLTVYLLLIPAVLSSRGFQTVPRLVSEVRIEESSGEQGRGLMELPQGRQDTQMGRAGCEHACPGIYRWLSDFHSVCVGRFHITGSMEGSG